MLIKGEKEKHHEAGREHLDEDEEELPFTQHVKVRVRRDSEDSFGSELTCSLPSSPIRLDKTSPILLPHTPSDPVPATQSLSSKSRRISWHLQEPLESRHGEGQPR